MPLGGLIPYGPTQKKKGQAGFGMQGPGLSAMLSSGMPVTRNTANQPEMSPNEPMPPPAAPPKVPAAPAAPSLPGASTGGNMLEWLQFFLGGPGGSQALGDPAPGPGSFRDLGKSPHTGNIAALGRMGLMAGVGGGNFNPGGAMLREHLVPTLSRALGKPVNVQRPTGEITRGDFALLLNSLLPMQGGGEGIQNHIFSDVIGTPYHQAAARLGSRGITAGVGGGRFNPSGILTREEFASLLANALRFSGKFNDPMAAPVTNG